MSAISSIVEKLCVVCGFGSHRKEWSEVEHPHCDHHSPDEVAQAIAKLQAPAPTAAPEPEPEPEPSVAEMRVLAFLERHGFSEDEARQEISRHGLYKLYQDSRFEQSQTLPPPPNSPNAV
jgi:hypothetical protein